MLADVLPRALPRRARWAIGVGLSLVAIVVGGRLDDAPTRGSYRPVLPPSVFGSRCDPLPPGVRLDLPVQLRADRRLVTGAGPVRRLDLHYDRRGPEQAEGSVADSLHRAGFVPTARPAGADPVVERWFVRRDYGRVGVGVRPFDVPAGSVVRGRLTLDLPPVTRVAAADDAGCTDPVRTKRFGSGAVS